MKYDFDKVVDRRGTHSLKWESGEKMTGHAGLLPLWVADMDFEAPREVVEAVRRRAAHGIYGYTARPDSYYEAVVDWMVERHGRRIEKDWIVFTPGVISALYQAVHAFSHAGDKVIIQSPVYSPFTSSVIRTGRQIAVSKLRLDGDRYTMDFDGLSGLIDERTRMLILCSPHNPVGRVWRREELERLAEICLERQIVIVSDEIHCDLVCRGHKHLPLAGLSPEVAAITVTCTAPNKTFNLAGLQMADIIIPNERLRSRFQIAASSAGLGMSNAFGITAAEAAYRHGASWLEQLLRYIEGNYEFLVDFLKSGLPRLRVFPLEGTYLAWLDFRAFGLGDEELRDTLMTKAGVWLDEGRKFGPGGEGFQRLNLACPRKTLADGLARIAAAFEGL